MTASGSARIINLFIGEMEENFGRLVSKFEWKSMINGGFIIRARLEDPYFSILDTLTKDGTTTSEQTMLRFGRQYLNRTLIRFQLRWNNGVESKESIAVMSDLHAVGYAASGCTFEFIAVDPISYYINSGDCSGKMYRGKIGGQKGVIMQVLNDYVPAKIGNYTVVKEVDETDDEENNYWMMRQDPKTFIASLLDWSSAFTKHRTGWVIASGGEQNGAGGTVKISIKEGYTPALKYPASLSNDSDTGGPFVLSIGGPASPTRDIIKWELMLDNFISALNTRIATSGISMVSGTYMDKTTDRRAPLKLSHLSVLDDNTELKLRPKISGDQGFTKPTELDKGWTHIMAIPEIYSAGDIGYNYLRYIDGRARQMYISMLNMLMRIKVTIRGEPRLYDSCELGRTKATLKWMRPDHEGNIEPRFINGDWLIYGWHHRVGVGDWETDVYLSRLDWNAAGVG